MDDITVLVLADPTERELAMLEALPDHTTIVAGNRLEAFEHRAPDADVILSWSLAQPLLERVWKLSHNVRWIHSRSAGLDNVLFPALVESPVTLTNSSGLFSTSLGEFALAAILFYAKGLRRMVRSQEAGLWDQFDVVELPGQTVGIVGYGDIGRAVAQRVRAMGMKVLALRRRPQLSSGDPLVDEVLPVERKSELMARSDYVVVTAPLTAETRGMIGAAELGAMKPEAILINVGRAAVVDEQALIAALTKRTIRGAALDVFNHEPLPAGHPFYGLDNLLLSPHCADHTPDWLEVAMRFFIENFERFRNGQALQNVVEKHLGY